MNFKALALSTIAAAATLLPMTAAKADTGKQSLLNAIDKAGVTLTVKACNNSRTAGTFSYYVGTMRDAEITVCANNARTSTEQWTTLRHEAVHLAQKCLNPNHGDTFETITNTRTLAESMEAVGFDANHVMNNYPKAKWAIEAEAFFWEEHLSNAETAYLVNISCN